MSSAVLILTSCGVTFVCISIDVAFGAGHHYSAFVVGEAEQEGKLRSNFSRG